MDDITRHRRRNTIAGALLALTAMAGLTSASPAQAVSTAHAAAPLAARAIPMDADPGPECGSTGGAANPCWKYETWYLDGSHCNEDGAAKVKAGPWDRFECVHHSFYYWLWLHRSY